MDALDRALDQRGASAFVIFGSSRDPDLRYLTRFVTGDPVVYIKRPGTQGVIVVSQMEASRAIRESCTAVMTRAEAGLLDIMKDEPDRWKALAKMITRVAGPGPLVVTPGMPCALERALSTMTEVHIDADTVPGLRRIKTPIETSWIMQAQKGADSAMQTALGRIRAARVEDGILMDGSSPLTSERVKMAMHTALLQCGCTAEDTIVASGHSAAMPHCTGQGPIHEGEPIVIDVFPKDDSSGYHSDMTRTLVRGTPSDEVREMYDAVFGAFTTACTLVRPGVTGMSVHESIVEYFRDHGYESGARGFTHNLGHGVGLEVHEQPSLGLSGEELVQGNVITIEPGLYYEGVGGVRIEDTGIVTKTGFSSFTRFPMEFQP